MNRVILLELENVCALSKSSRLFALLLPFPEIKLADHIDSILLTLHGSE